MMMMVTSPANTHRHKNKLWPSYARVEHRPIAAANKKTNTIMFRTAMTTMAGPRRVPDVPNRQEWTVVALMAASALVGAITALVVFGVLQARDDGRYRRGRNDLRDVRGDITDLDLLLANCTCNCSSCPTSCNCTTPVVLVGDVATDRKTTAMTIPTDVITNITGWDAATSFPFNGAATSSWDPVAGLYTAPRNGTYSATFDAAVLLGGGSPATVAISFLLTNSTGPSVAFFPSLAAVDDNNAVVQTIASFVGVLLQAGDTIQFAVIKTGAASVDMTAFSMSVMEQ